MRVATFSIAGERRVGLVDLDAQTIAPFDFSVDQAKSGILALIERNGAVTCSTVQLLFRVSAATARRDLDQLGREGVVLRVHGGAMLP